MNLVAQTAATDAGDVASVGVPAPTAECMSVVVVEDVCSLTSHVSVWEDLAASALEPNVFHEPWMMLPALRQFGIKQHLVFLLIFAASATNSERPKLCGFFPLQRVNRYKGLPLACLRVWRHLHCVLSTPLIRAGYGPQTLQTLFSWLRQDTRGAGLLELGFVSADGPFHQVLMDGLNARRALSYSEEVTTRALLRIGDGGEAYLKAALSSGNRKELRRQRRRLGELGQLEARSLVPGDDAEPWINQFLQLEAGGWKGRSGTALSAQANERSFFQSIAREAHARNRLRMLGLFLNGQPIAIKCNFLMGEGAIAFKIAFDETYARFSPGVQLELENILQAHAQPSFRWMDSCAISGHCMINRLWKDRRVMQTVLVSTGRRIGDFAVSVMPLFRWLKRLIRRKPKTGDAT